MASKSAPSPMMAEEKRWKAESDLRTLTEAADIKRDKSRVTAARRIGKKQMSSLRRIVGSR